MLGASEADPATRRFFGGAKSFPGQFTIRDARGIAVDPDNGRLFVTGSFESRVVVFHFPRDRAPPGEPVDVGHNRYHRASARERRARTRRDLEMTA